MPIQSATPPRAAQLAVNDAIRSAARSTGTSFAYLLATAKAESGLDPKQGATTSSARGLFQFVDQTWLMMLKEAGPALGYGGFSQAIAANASGRYEVADPVTRQAALALRDDPAANAALAGAFTRRNAAQLSGQLGRAPSEGELYIAHFLGGAGAAKLITLAGSLPEGAAAIEFPEAAAANRSIFFDRAGQARTVAEVYGVLVGRYENARRATSAAATTTGGTPIAAPTPPAREAASLPAREAASQPVAGGGSAPLFHGLFQSDQRRGGVSNFIAELWSTRPQVAAALSGGSLAATDQSALARPSAPPSVARSK